MQHLDGDPDHFALTQAITAVARASHNGTKEQVQIANRNLGAAINAFPPERRKGIEQMAQNSVREQRLKLHVAAQNSAEVREREALNRWIDQLYSGTEQGLKR